MRCFIIANGPSLNQMDLTKLKDEITFGCNSIIRHIDDLGFRVKYYFNIDSIQALLTVKESLEYISHDEVEAGYFNPNHKEFIKCDKCRFLSLEEYHSCRTVGLAMIWKALELGYKPIYLIRFDMTYNYPSKNQLKKCNSINDIPCNTEIKEILHKASPTINWSDLYLFPENINDSSHFANDYVEHQIPIHYETTDVIVDFYREAFNAKSLKSDVYNAGIGGKLDFIKRVNYESLF